MADEETEKLRKKVMTLRDKGDLAAYEKARPALVERDHAFTHLVNAVIAKRVPAGIDPKLLAAAEAEVARLTTAKAARRAKEAQ